MPFIVTARRWISSPVGGSSTRVPRFDELIASKPLDAIGAYTGPMLVVHGDKDVTILPAENEAVVAAYPKASIVLVPEADHGYGFYSDQPAVSALVESSFAEFFSTNLK